VNRLRRLLATLLLIVAWPSAVWGATAWDLISPKNFDPQSRTERLAVARDLRTRVEQFAALIEPQTPAELQGLERAEARLAANDRTSNRERAELQLSVAYQQRKLAAALTAITTALDCVIDTQRIATEMSCWATTSLLLGDEESLRLALSTLRNHHRLPRNKDLPALVRSPEVWYTTYGRGILEFILVPYLRRAAAAEP
jgi:hypothetical protein